SIWISSHRTVSLRTTKGRKCRKCLPYRSKNVVQVAAKPRKSERKSEQNGEKQLAPFCYKLSLFSGLRRLRQVLVNLVPRFASRGAPVRSRPRPPTIFMSVKYRHSLPRITPATSDGALGTLGLHSM